MKQWQQVEQFLLGNTNCFCLSSKATLSPQDSSCSKEHLKFDLVYSKLCFHGKVNTGRARTTLEYETAAVGGSWCTHKPNDCRSYTVVGMLLVTLKIQSLYKKEKKEKKKSIDVRSLGASSVEKIFVLKYSLCPRKKTHHHRYSCFGSAGCGMRSHCNDEIPHTNRSVLRFLRYFSHFSL